MDEREMIAMTARMQGQSTVARSLGKKHLVSDMELLALCNMARLGCLSVFAALDGETGALAEAQYEAFAGTLRTAFAKPGQNNGLQRIMQTCVAILHEGRLAQYVLREEEDQSGKEPA